MRVVTIVAVVCLAQINGAPAARPAAVGKPTRTSAIAEPHLEKTPWKAIELGGRPVAPARAGHELSVAFGTRGDVTVNDGCSRRAATFQMMGPLVKFGPLGDPPACAGGREGARQLRSALASAHVWRIKEGRLEFRDSSGTLLARFESPSAGGRGTSAPSLERTAWRVVKLPGNRALPAAESGKYIVAFGDHSRLSALVGCQRGRGTWKVSGRSDLQFGPLGLASSKCASNPVSSRVIADWRRVQSYVVRNGHLFLSLMGDGGVYEFEPVRSARRRKPPRRRGITAAGPSCGSSSSFHSH